MFDGQTESTCSPFFSHLGGDNIEWKEESCEIIKVNKTSEKIQGNHRDSKQSKCK
jgi:hypothetical protein